jgi:hypothetical protein
VKIGSAIDQPNVPLPGGVYLGFSENKVKDSVTAYGLAGVCYKDGVPDEAAIAAGECGTRTAWALSGDVPLGDLPIDAFSGGVNNIDFGKVLTRVLPLAKRFNSSVKRDVQYSLKAKLADGGFDTSTLTEYSHDFAPTAPGQAPNQSLPVAFNYVAEAPDLPKYRGNFADALILLGGASVPGRGIVPLGAGVAVNSAPADAKADVQSGLSKPGLISIRQAPTHNGLEGSTYGILSLALSIKSLTDASSGVATTALFSRLPGNRLAFDPSGATPVSLGAAFLPFPEGARYNYSTAARGALPGRTFKIASAEVVTGAALVRVLFSDKLDHRWVVYLAPSQVTAGFTLPAPPQGFGDRTFYAGGNADNDERSTLAVQALGLNSAPGAGGSALTFAQLVELNATNADRVVDFLTGFSFIDYNRPQLSFANPSTAGAAVQGGKVTVKVNYFKVGSSNAEDGYVRLSGCGNAPTEGKAEVTAGKGEVSLNVPAGCTGNVTLTATLVDAAGDPLVPNVARTLQVSVP